MVGAFPIAECQVFTLEVCHEKRTGTQLLGVSGFQSIRMCPSGQVEARGAFTLRAQQLFAS
jgi:hypothetical protein